jgi:hypothetical protein
MLCCEQPTPALAPQHQPASLHRAATTPAAVVRLRIEKSTKGRVGIGLQPSKQHDSALVVSSVAPSSLAKAAGFEIGDVLLSVEANDCRMMSKHKANALLFDAKGVLDVSVLRLPPRTPVPVPAPVPILASPSHSGKSSKRKRADDDAGSPSLGDLLSHVEAACDDLTAVHATASTAETVANVKAAVAAHAPSPLLLPSEMATAGSAHAMPPASAAGGPEGGPEGGPKAGRVASLKSRLAALADKVGTRSFQAQERVLYKHPSTGEVLEAVVVQVHDTLSPPQYSIACGMNSYRAQAHQLRAHAAEEPSPKAVERDVDDVDDGASGDAEPQVVMPKLPQIGHRPRPDSVPALDLTARGIGGNAMPMRKETKNYGW